MFTILDSQIDSLCQTLRERGLPPDVRVIYRARNIVAAWRPNPDTEEVNIKSFKVPHIINRVVYGNIRKSKARRSYLYAKRLLELGFHTPRPYAYVELFGRGHTLERSYYVSEQLPDCWHETRSIERRPDFDRLVRALALWACQLARCGVLVKDFSPGNVLMRDDGAGEWEFALVDLNRMAFDVDDKYRLVERAGRLFDSEQGTRLFADIYAAELGLSQKRCRRLALSTYYKFKLKILRRETRE